MPGKKRRSRCVSVEAEEASVWPLKCASCWQDCGGRRGPGALHGCLSGHYGHVSGPGPGRPQQGQKEGNEFRRNVDGESAEIGDLGRERRRSRAGRRVRLSGKRQRGRKLP